jgi:hypothetical protein
MLVLGPTKELVEQLTRVGKSLAHTAKFSSASLTSAGGKGDQRGALAAPVDVVFATPGRLLQHNEEGAVHLGDVQWVVVDEADTMILKVRGLWLGAGRVAGSAAGLAVGLAAGCSSAGAAASLHSDAQLPCAAHPLNQTPRPSLPPPRPQGFEPEVRKIIGAVKGKPEPAQVVLVSATVPPEIQRLMSTLLPAMRPLRTASLHKAIAGSRHQFVSVPPGGNKLALAAQLVQGDAARKRRALVFCGTVDRWGPAGNVRADGPRATKRQPRLRPCPAPAVPTALNAPNAVADP